MIRRGIALVGGLLILILLVLGVKGCLNARKERALKDYARDVSQIVDETSQTSKAFFNRLEDPGDLSVTEFEAVLSLAHVTRRIQLVDTGEVVVHRATVGVDLVLELGNG